LFSVAGLTPPLLYLHVVRDVRVQRLVGARCGEKISDLIVSSWIYVSDSLFMSVDKRIYSKIGGMQTNIEEKASQMLVLHCRK
jgi:hypothetical protein